MLTESISAKSQKMDYMNLLIEQMKNQNPLDPMSNQEMASQMAMFAQLEQTEEMNANIKEMNASMTGLSSSFQGAMLMAEYDYARSLLGKEVTFYSGEYAAELSGKVDKISIDSYTGATKASVNVKDFETSKGEKVTDTIEIGLIAITGISEV